MLIAETDFPHPDSPTSQGFPVLKRKGHVGCSVEMPSSVLWTLDLGRKHSRYWFSWMAEQGCAAILVFVTRMRLRSFFGTAILRLWSAIPAIYHRIEFKLSVFNDWAWSVH